MKICYFGIYDPNFSRNKVYMRGLRELGVEIIECRDNSKGILKLWRLWKKHRMIESSGGYDAMIVGYPGHLVVPLARMISNKPVIADLLGSLYDAEVHSHKPNVVKKSKARIIDWLVVKYADKILLESEAQKKYFEQRFGKSNKYKVVYTGVDEQVYGTTGVSGTRPYEDSDSFPQPHKGDRERVLSSAGASVALSEGAVQEHSNVARENMVTFTILFRGKLTPECGIGYILKAAEILKSYPEIQFKVVGGGYLLNETERIIREKELKNVTLISKYLTEAEMHDAIQGASLYLGQFENNPRLSRTIPHKAFEAFVGGVPYLTADAEAIRELVVDNETGFLVPVADADAIAKKVLELSRNTLLLEKVSMNAKEMYEKKLAPNKLVQGIVEAIVN